MFNNSESTESVFEQIVTLAVVTVGAMIISRFAAPLILRALSKKFPQEQ